MSEHTQSLKNRKARFNYEILETHEAGIILQGTEVKSLREGRANIVDAHAGEMDGELYLFNLYIAEYSGGNRFNHEVRRPRKLLLHKREINKLMGKIQAKGLSLIPLSIYFNKRGFVKVELALGKGKKLYDKRATEKERDWKREKAGIVKNQFD